MLTDALRQHPYFESCTTVTLDRLTQAATRHTFAANEAVFLEADPALGLWLVEAGSVKVFKVNAEGIEHILHLLSVGNTFNEIAALDGGTNPANATALSDAHLWLIPAASLDQALTTDAAFARRVIHLLAARVRGLVHQIEDLALYGVVVRLARFLLRQSEDPSFSAPGVTRATIAAYLATTPETVSRALRTLEASGAIQFDRHRIVIVREDLLRVLAAL